MDDRLLRRAAQNVTFNNGETSANSSPSPSFDDDVDDDDERVLLEFGTMPDERVSAGVHAEASLTIDDDDDPPRDGAVRAGHSGCGRGARRST